MCKTVCCKKNITFSFSFKTLCFIPPIYNPALTCGIMDFNVFNKYSQWERLSVNRIIFLFSFNEVTIKFNIKADFVFLNLQ